MIIAQIKKYQTIMRTEVWKWVTCTVFRALAIDSVYGENYSSKATVLIQKSSSLHNPDELQKLLVRAELSRCLLISSED